MSKESKLIHEKFINNVLAIIKQDANVIGLAVGGSYITNEIDEYSDLDFVIVTSDKVAPDQNNMLDYARKFGDLLAGFTGEHVGEKRLLICLYKDPLLHVDFKFVTTDEFYDRVENPVILWEVNGVLSQIIKTTEAK